MCSPLTPTFEDVLDDWYLMSSLGAADSRLTIQDYYGSSDQYYDVSTDFSYPTSGKPSCHSGDHVALGGDLFSDGYGQINPQACWPNTDIAEANELTYASVTLSRSSLHGYSGDQATDTRPNGNYVSPSVLNAGTDPDSHWPVGQDASERACIMEETNQNEGTCPQENKVDTTDLRGPESSKPPSRDNPSRGLQSSHDRADGSSPESKERIGPMTSNSGAGENPIHLRTASRKAKRTSTSYKPATSPEEQRARSSHNQVEKQYRSRLNYQFERLLAVLPPPIDRDERVDGDDVPKNSDRRLSKMEVLEIAQQHIRMLEKEALELDQERLELMSSLGRVTGVTRNGGSGYGTTGK